MILIIQKVIYLRNFGLKSGINLKSHNMKKILSFTLLLLACISIANAQIKIVGNEYSDSLSAAKKYYEQDIDFNALVTIGDTFYLSETHLMKGSEFTTNENGLFDGCLDMPIGYYVRSGYVFCIENENAIRVSAHLPQYQYSSYSRDLEKTIYNLKEELLYLTNEESEDKERMVFGYLRYIIFNSTDTNNTHTYYCKPDIRPIISLSYYNELRTFINKEVVIGVVTWDSLYSYQVILDDLTGNLIRLKDKSFLFKDVVLKGNNLYIVLEGKETGSFGREVENIVYAYDKYDLLKNDNSSTGDIACFIIRGKQIDVGDYFYEMEDFFVIKKGDIKNLYARPKIASAQHEKELKIKQRQLDKERKKKEENFRRKMIAKYGAEKGTLVGNRQVAIGMTEEMVRDAWRRPWNTYRTTTKYGKSEVWCYNYKTRVYFYNGKVVQIDD